MASITELKGIGEKTAKLFEKVGVKSVDDLIHYYPRAYDTYYYPVFIGDIKPDTIAAIKVRLMKTASVVRYGHVQVTTVTAKDPTGSLQLVWFNQPYLRGTLTAGSEFIFRGKVSEKKGRRTMDQPEIFQVDTYMSQAGLMRPIYGQTKGLGNKTIVKTVEQALDLMQLEREYMPESIRRRHQLSEINFSLKHIHFPENEQDLLYARKRMVFDEFMLFLMSVRMLKTARDEADAAYPIRLSGAGEKVLKSLKYDLTGAQKRVLEDIYKDIGSGKTMNRLIQGDVGSGKTILAILACLEAIMNGYQAALMVPTEVLARQHMESVEELFEGLDLPVYPILLTGSMTAKEKRLAYARIADGEANFIIGTHALIQEKVSYKDLALVVTDEQHRFGVNQREMLGKKGERPHVLVMSATPIPRTLAIILYGDLDISVIDELPSHRKPIRNCVVGTDYRDKAYRFIEKEVAMGHQVYVVCPMVEESEMIEAEDVINYTKRLRDELDKNIHIEYLHGKMKPKEKNALMEAFAENRIQVLVSTTVIEVGINVPNATVMMIENAERFGLAQLHQLRGRVGRGDAQSYCIMVDGSKEDGVRERLEILNKSNDGFFIASEDLKLRGPGDIFGVRQSGDLEFKIGDIYTDAKVLAEVSEEIKALFERDPELEDEENQELKRKMLEFTREHFEQLNL